MQDFLEANQLKILDCKSSLKTTMQIFESSLPIFFLQNAPLFHIFPLNRSLNFKKAHTQDTQKPPRISPFRWYFNPRRSENFSALATGNGKFVSRIFFKWIPTPGQYLRARKGSHRILQGSAWEKQGQLTPPKTNMEPENEPWKRRFLLKTIIFRFHVSFRGGKWILSLSKFQTHQGRI